MKVKEGFLIRKVASQYVVMPCESETTVDFNGMISLNESGAFLWNHLINETTKEELVKAMLEEYEVDEATASKDIDAFIKILDKNNLLDL